MRVRIKICGITLPEDALAAARHGADAVGLMFYSPSPRHVTLACAQEISSRLPPFVARVAVFVDPTAEEVAAAIQSCRPDMLQFHGAERPDFCRRFGVPYLKAVRVRSEVDLLEYLAPFHDAAGWLLDTHRDGLYGGTGATFDWATIPPQLDRPLILSGGLNPENVAAGIRRTRPWAVDVSSGVESAQGIKDERLIAAFIAGVRNADL